MKLAILLGLALLPLTSSAQMLQQKSSQPQDIDYLSESDIRYIEKIHNELTTRTLENVKATTFASFPCYPANAIQIENQMLQAGVFDPRTAIGIAVDICRITGIGGFVMTIGSQGGILHWFVSIPGYGMYFTFRSG